MADLKHCSNHLIFFSQQMRLFVQRKRNMAAFNSVGCEANSFLCSRQPHVLVLRLYELFKKSNKQLYSECDSRPAAECQKLFFEVMNPRDMLSSNGTMQPPQRPPKALVCFQPCTLCYRPPFLTV